MHLVTAGAALLLACTLAPTTRPKGSGELFANLLLVSSWKHDWWQALSPVSWSLCCEAFFYMLFPALFAVARRLGPRALFAAAGLCVAVVIALPWAGQHYALGWDLYASPLLRLPEFVLGIVLARLVWLDVWRGPGVGVSLVIAVAGYSLTSVVPADYHHAACTVLGFGSLIAAGAVADLNGTWSVWRGRRSVRLGELSFAFYMIHILVIRTGEYLFTAHPKLPAAPGPGAAAAAFTVSLFLAWALYEGVETPCRRLLQPRARRDVTADPATVT